MGIIDDALRSRSRFAATFQKGHDDRSRIFDRLLERVVRPKLRHMLRNHSRRLLGLLPLGLIVGLSAGAAVADRPPEPGYPAHWWKPVPREEAHSWEVLPQEAGPGEVILSKRNELGLLSNFAATPFTLDGITYPSLEGFWQMMKYPESADDPRATHPGVEWKYRREEVARMTAFEAKKAGDLASQNMEKMGINWVSYRGRRMTYRTSEKGEHYDLIVRATWAKVRQNRNVRDVLVRTGDLRLRPDHHQGADAPPAWRYYNVYMEIREQLRTAGDTQAAGFLRSKRNEANRE